jgi:hypothetical protein
VAATSSENRVGIGPAVEIPSNMAQLSGQVPSEMIGALSLINIILIKFCSYIFIFSILPFPGRHPDLLYPSCVLSNFSK